MSLRRHTIAFGLTTLLYAAAVVLLWRLQPHAKPFALHPQKAQRLHVSLSAFRKPSPKSQVSQPSQAEPTPPKPEPQQTKLEPKPEPKRPEPVPDLPEPKPEPKPMEQPKRQPDDKPPVVKPPVKPKPHPTQKAKHPKRTAKSKVHRKPRPHRRKPTRTAATHKKHTKAKRKSAASSHAPSRAASVQSAAQTQAFLAALRRRIEAHKFYPPVAKRRGMQGSVRVRFRVLQNGNVSAVRVSGSRLFFRSAKEAVRAAFPVSTKHAGVRFPLDVTLTLHYRLR